MYDVCQNYLLQEDSASSVPISSIFQGSLWKTIKLKFIDKIVFPLYLYFDDFECCNPLGSKAGIHKIGAVYVSLVCMPPEYASLLENILLAQLFYSKDRVLVGNQKIFSKLIEEFCYLHEHGIDINVNSKTVPVYFTVILILGDNLGLNSILGFNESFNAQYFCRICKTSREESKVQSVEDICTLRTVKNYEESCKNLDFGIKSQCVFNVLPAYHVTENISLDLMHDMLEGVLRYDMAYILSSLIKK